jgi:hypothetical protein
MVKIRSLREALFYIKSLDNDTGISGNAIRMLVVSGKVPSFKVGKKYLVNVDMLLQYFEEKLSVDAGDDLQKPADLGEVGDDIRPIPEQLKRQKVALK